MIRWNIYIYKEQIKFYFIKHAYKKVLKIIVVFVSKDWYNIRFRLYRFPTFDFSFSPIIFKNFERPKSITKARSSGPIIKLGGRTSPCKIPNLSCSSTMRSRHDFLMTSFISRNEWNTSPSMKLVTSTGRPKNEQPK